MYRVWIEEVLGFKLRANRLSVEPVIPPGWDGFGMSYRYGATEYRITVENPDYVSVGVASSRWTGGL